LNAVIAMPIFYVTKRSVCLVDFVHRVEAESALEATAKVDENDSAGEYMGCSVLDKTSDPERVMSAELAAAGEPDVEFVNYACVAKDMLAALKESVRMNIRNVQMLEAISNGNEHVTTVVNEYRNSIDECEAVIARCS
jgi:hypothetical protein